MDRKKFRQGIIAAAALACFTPLASHAAVVGFSGFGAVNKGADSSSVPGYSSDSSTFTLTNLGDSEAVSGFNTAAQDDTGFQATFTYTVVGGNGQNTQYSEADGFAFVIQNDTRGTAALGGDGGSHGYSAGNTGGASAISPSIALGYEMYGGQSVSLSQNGTQTVSNSVGNITALNDGNPIQFTINYTGTTLTEAIYDTGTKQSYFATCKNVNIPSIVGATSALVGFSGGTGGANATQQISNFTYVATDQLSYAPISLTSSGFNQGMVIPASAPTTGAGAFITATMDAGTAKTGSTFYEMGYDPTNTGGNTGLPTSGSVFTSQADSRHVFQMQSYSANDALLLTSSNRSGTLTFTTPSVEEALSILVSAGHGPAPFSVTINYADSAPSITIPSDVVTSDWFNGGIVAWDAEGRGYAGTGATTYDNINNGNPNLYQLDVLMPDTTDPIASITFNYDGASTSTDLAIFAVSGAVVPEPASTSLLVTALGSLLLKRRKRDATIA